MTTLPDRRTLTVVNESTVISDTDAWRATWCLGYQARWQFSPTWGIDAYVTFSPKGGTIPPGSSILHILDTSDQQGALGYHDVDQNEVPYARVFAKTADEAGLQFPEVLSHEGLELLIDPLCVATALDEASGRLYPMEVCDACQGSSYDLGAPYNRPVGVIVADFVTPDWFDENTPAANPTSYRSALSGPFALGSGGYLSYATTIPANWQQEFGQHADRRIADADDRHQRRIAA